MNKFFPTPATPKSFDGLPSSYTNKNSLLSMYTYEF